MSKAQQESCGGGTTGSVSRSEGRIEEFNALWCEHWPRLWAIAYSRLRDASLAEDVANETYRRLWRRWQNGEGVPNPQAWLRVTARNLAADYAKAAFRRRWTQGVDVISAIWSTEPSPESAVMAAEIVGMALDQLATADRELIVLKSEGFSNKELAERFGRPVKHWLERVKADLCDRMNRLSAESTRNRKRKPRSAS